jgi:hypothetical protein
VTPTVNSNTHSALGELDEGARGARSESEAVDDEDEQQAILSGLAATAGESVPPKGKRVNPKEDLNQRALGVFLRETFGHETLPVIVVRVMNQQCFTTSEYGRGADAGCDHYRERESIRSGENRTIEPDHLRGSLSLLR